MALTRGERSTVRCPHCRGIRAKFLTQKIYSWWRRFFGWPYVAVICWSCKNIVGWEWPEDEIKNRRIV